MTQQDFLDGKVKLFRGDCLDVLPLLEENSIDSCVTDPPYHLTSIVKRFGSPNAAPNTPGVYARGIRGFMGKQWDGGDIAFKPETWAEVWRVMKPGAHLLAFGGTRTYDLLANAIRRADFDIRDCIFYLYGSGFPKSHNLGNGYGSALKPACEPIVLARKPLSEPSISANVLRHGTGGINVDGCRIAGDMGPDRAEGKPRRNTEIYGTANPTLNPQSPLGRWPANLIHDGSEEVLAGFPETGPSPQTYTRNADGFGKSSYRVGEPAGKESLNFGDSGSAARFFYTSKADADDRLGSKHPTVKPLDLIQYLIRLITPANGVVLDCFAGTGTAGEAAFREGFKALLIEREAEYQADIVKRMGLCLAGPDTRRIASIKQLPHDDLPIFGGTP